MKYQNPMEPTDSTEFISQTAQFTLVEQMENMAASNADMLNGHMSATAASLIGKTVQWNTALGDETDAPGVGTVQGVRITTDGPVLIVDGWDVPLARVTAFGDAPPPEDQQTPPTDGTDTEETGDTAGAPDASDQTDATDGSNDTEVPGPEDVVQTILDELETINPPVIPTDLTAPAAS
jgi:flagellar basal-body rod modification protein FlgD